MVKESALLDETLEQTLLFLVNTLVYFHYVSKGACYFGEHWHIQVKSTQNIFCKCKK